MAEENSSWFSIGQAAKYLGVSRDTLRRWEKRGKIKAVRSPTDRRYYTKNLLDEVMLGEQKALDQKKAPAPRLRLSLGNEAKLVLLGLLGFIIAVIFFFLTQSLLPF